MFTLEAVKAKHGDCLLLHWGTTAAPGLMLIDGGPGGTYKKFLKPRLQELAAARGAAQVPIDLAMVSHIDDDHIAGLLDLVEEMEGQSAPATIARLWHNSLEGLLHETFNVASLNKATASLAGSPPECTELWYSKVLASVRQGQLLHGFAKRLRLDTTMNAPYQPIVAVAPGQRPMKLRGLSVTVIGPSAAEIEKLRKEWKKKRVAGITAAYADDSPYNLSSIIVLVEFEGKRMLLTGDARGDHIIAGLKSRRLLKNGNFHVDLLKLPHHGSQNNVTKEFFEQVTADVYVVSGDGKMFPNPHKSTMKWLADARGSSRYKIYCTYDLAHMRSRFGSKLIVPDGGKSSISAKL